MDDKTGDCCICGANGKLSFEHVPPQAAFNDRRVFEANINGLLNGKWSPGERIEEGKYKQRGAGRYSLCGKCNSDTGGWYGSSYVDVARQAMYRLHYSQGNMAGLAYPYGMFPLRFLKQISAMFFSACGPALQDRNPDLVRFVLNKDERRLPPQIRYFAYLHHPTDSTCIRQSGITGMMRGSHQFLFSEIAFPPFGLIMSINSPPVHTDLCEITHLNQYSYRQWDVVYLKLPVFPVTTWFPGDFRTVEGVLKDQAENRKVGSMFLDPQIPTIE
jgi:hypothetical protein